MWRRGALVALAVGLLPACDSHAADDRVCRTFELESEPVDSQGDEHVFVVDSIELPETDFDVERLGLDLDGDALCDVDNALGGLVSLFGGDYDLDSEAKKLIDQGAILHLLDVKAVSLDEAAGVSVTILHAEDTDGDPTDNFSGEEVFGIDVGRGRGLATGRITAGGGLTVSRGNAPVAITFPGLEEPFVLPLVGVRIEAIVNPDGMSGRIAGGILVEDIELTLLPVWVEALNRVLAKDCSVETSEPFCTAGSTGETLQDLFDEDGNFVISLEELRDSSVAASALSPDVDLIDADGEFSPRTDGIRDALSIGFGFTAVPAIIDPTSPSTVGARDWTAAEID